MMICSLTQQLASLTHDTTTLPPLTQAAHNFPENPWFVCVLRLWPEARKNLRGKKEREKEWSNCRTKCKQTLPFIFHSVKEAQEMQTSEVNSPKGNGFNYRTILPKNLKSNSYQYIELQTHTYTHTHTHTHTPGTAEDRWASKKKERGSCIFLIHSFRGSAPFWVRTCTFVCLYFFSS